MEQSKWIVGMKNNFPLSTELMRFLQKLIIYQHFRYEDIIVKLLQVSFGYFGSLDTG